jgi:hypothetical protein
VRLEGCHLFAINIESSMQGIGDGTVTHPLLNSHDQVTE